MKRREFITLFGGAAAAWPLAGRAQQAAMPVIGYFSSRSSGTEGPIRGPFLKALEESGFVAGRNVAINTAFRRDGTSVCRRLPPISWGKVCRCWSRLIDPRPWRQKRRPRQFQSCLPAVSIQFQFGLVASFDRPGGNATGVSLFTTGLGQKRLGLLRELLPKQGAMPCGQPE